MFSCYTGSVKKKKGKHLRFLIEVSEFEGEYDIITTQLSNIPIPLTEFEKTYSSPFMVNSLKGGQILN
jgi:hypothetical protein